MAVFIPAPCDCPESVNLIVSDVSKRIVVKTGRTVRYTGRSMAKAERVHARWMWRLEHGCDICKREATR